MTGSNVRRTVIVSPGAVELKWIAKEGWLMVTATRAVPVCLTDALQNHQVWSLNRLFGRVIRSVLTGWNAANFTIIIRIMCECPKKSPLSSCQRIPGNEHGGPKIIPLPTTSILIHSTFILSLKCILCISKTKPYVLLLIFIIIIVDWRLRCTTLFFGYSYLKKQRLYLQIVVLRLFQIILHFLSYLTVVVQLNLTVCLISDACNSNLFQN